MKPIILFRTDSENKDEFFVAQKYFEVTKNRNAIPPDRLVIGRYSTLPYFRELEEDVNLAGSKLIDTYSEFNYVASFDYYFDIEPYTFKTWFEAYDIPDNCGPLVVKGTTNSKKGWWNTKMFCENKQVAILTARDLMEDSLFHNQKIIYRKYEKLKTYEKLLNDLPVTDEYRFFFYKKTELCHGYYWHNAEDLNHQCAPEGIELAHKVASIVSEWCNFFVVDVAQKDAGGWVVVELNHGTMSGLSACDPEELYSNLAKAIEEDAKPKWSVSVPKHVGVMPTRTDEQIRPETPEEIQAKKDAYKHFQNRYDNDSAFRAKVDAECVIWEAEYEAGKLEYEAWEREQWAKGIPTHPIPYHYFKPYPKMMDPYPHGGAFTGWEILGMKVVNLLGDILD